ncbi:MAG: hypothetical protein JO237_13630, partial [Pseudolabrys sp.]|nr:hypothetical protein [Pseudolabrys sp.]
MSGASNIWLRDPRLAAHALSPAPAWLWNAAATRLLWANPTGAAILQAASPAAALDMEFDPSQVPVAQIARLSATLPTGAMPRLERLQGFGADQNHALTCICSRIALDGGEPAILVVATERAGPDLPLTQRIEQMLLTLNEPVAVFSAEGELIAASRAGRNRLGASTNLDTLDAQALARQASHAGHAQGRISIGNAKLERLNAGNVVVLLLTLERETAPNVAAPPVAAPDAVEIETPAPSSSRGPLMRFVWQSDADNRFLVESEDFIALAGWKTKEALGSPWVDFAAALGLDPDHRIATALASHATWSALPVRWPVDGTDERVTVELSGLPTFDRERVFQGYRGFGVCREVERLKALAANRERAVAEGKLKAEADAPASAAAA